MNHTQHRTRRHYLAAVRNRAAQARDALRMRRLARLTTIKTSTRHRVMAGLLREGGR